MGGALLLSGLLVWYLLRRRRESRRAQGGKDELDGSKAGGSLPTSASGAPGAALPVSVRRYLEDPSNASGLDAFPISGSGEAGTGTPSMPGTAGSSGLEPEAARQGSSMIYQDPSSIGATSTHSEQAPG